MALARAFRSSALGSGDDADAASNDGVEGLDAGDVAAVAPLDFFFFAFRACRWIDTAMGESIKWVKDFAKNVHSTVRHSSSNVT